MQLKTVSAIGVGCLSIHALLNLTSNIVNHQKLVAMHDRFVAVGINTSSLDPPWLLVTSMIGTLLFNGAFILFFVVLYRHQTNSVLSR